MSIIEDIRNQGVHKEVGNISKSLVGQPLAKNETLEEDLCRSVNTLNKAFELGQVPVLDLLKAAKNIGKLTKKRKLITRGGRTFLTTVYVDESGTESMSDIAHTAYETPESLKAIEHLHRGDNVRVIRKDGSVVEGTVSGLSGLSSGKIELAVRVEGQKWDKLIDPGTVKSVEKVVPEKGVLHQAMVDYFREQPVDADFEQVAKIAEQFPEYDKSLKSKYKEIFDKEKADFKHKDKGYEIPGTKDAVDVTGKSEKIPQLTIEEVNKIKTELNTVKKDLTSAEKQGSPSTVQRLNKRKDELESQLKSYADSVTDKMQVERFKVGDTIKYKGEYSSSPGKAKETYITTGVVKEVLPHGGYKIKNTTGSESMKIVKEEHVISKDVTAKEKAKKEELNSESFKNLILRGYRLKESDIATKHSHRAGYKPTFQVSDDKIYANFSTGDTVMGTGGYYTEYLMNVSKDGEGDYGVVLRISSNKNNYTNDNISDKSVIDYESYPTFEEAKDRLINYLKE